jgi:predicted AlkP superfamily pyrophosphatase or phosphodiesterase
MASNFRSKVISISLKDRGAILPGGHAANAAYWHDLDSSPGNFVSSTYYMQELPDWVTKFNNQGRSDTFLNDTWNTLYPINTYVESAPDDNPYERSIGGKTIPTFPYDFKSIRERFKVSGNEYQLLWLSPFGNTLLTEFALEALRNENLGQGKFTDFLCLSYTVSDIIGHTLGPQSVEMEDMYLRLDKEIAQLLNTLDASPGKGNYILFLTADHGAVPVVSYLKDKKLPGGVASIARYKFELTNYLNSKYGAFEWIKHFESEHVYLNRSLLAQKKLNPQEFEQDVASFLLTRDGISWAVTAHQLQSQSFTEGMKALLQRGYDPKRSGDVILSFDPGFVPQANASMTTDKIKGTTHGTGYSYDRHVPLLWIGKGIPNGESVRNVSPTDIAATIALMLDIQFPSGSDGYPLEELFMKN